MWWLDPEEDLSFSTNKDAEIPKKDIDWNQKYCNHEWKEIQLITSKVYNCIKCDVKKEEYEKWEASKWI